MDMKRYPKELKQKVVAALYELDNSGDATPGAIAKIARDNGINANVVYQWNSERKASANSVSDKINKIKAVVDTAAMNEHELGQWLRANGVPSVSTSAWTTYRSNLVRAEKLMIRKCNQIMQGWIDPTMDPWRTKKKTRSRFLQKPQDE